MNPHIQVALSLVSALGLLSSIIGSWLALRSTPIVGGDRDGYLDVIGGANTDVLHHRQRTGWVLLLVGFLCQFVAATGQAYSAFSALH